MSNKIDKFSVLFVKRNAAKRGPTSSEAWNDTIEELSHDLTELSAQWNERLVPLAATLPNGSEGNVENAVDAWTDGLDGKTLFVDALATSTDNSNYFNGPADRPNTLLEQLEDIYLAISELESSIASQISASSPTAEQIVITDTGALYLASNVETALQEVMETAQLALSTGSDLSNVESDIIPSQDDLYNLGSVARRWADLHLGPASLNIASKLADGGSYVDKDFHIGIEESATGKLQIKDGTTVLAEFDAVNGVGFPQGLSSVNHSELSSLSADDHTQYSLADGTRAFTGTVSGVFPIADAHLATKAYVDSLVQGLDWQESVKDQTSTPPGSPTTGDRYIVGAAATGAWSGHDEEIAEWNGSSWDFITPTEGAAVYDESDDFLYVYNSSYPAGSWVPLASAIDHGNLQGLADDDHTQYALLAGRGTNQTLIGGLASGNTLTLQSTAHATKGKILFGTSAYDEANNRLGLGTVSPANRLDVNGSIAVGSFAGTTLLQGDSVVAAGRIHAGANTSSTYRLYSQAPDTDNTVATFTHYNTAQTQATTWNFHGLAGLTSGYSTNFHMNETGSFIYVNTSIDRGFGLANGSVVFPNIPTTRLWISDPTSGGKVGIGNGTVDATGALSVLGNLAVGSSTYYTSATIPTNGLIVEGTVGIGTLNPATATAKIDCTLSSTSTTLAGFEIAQESTGDAFMRFALSTSFSYAMGIDNSDGDKFKLAYTTSAGGGPDTGTLLWVTSAGSLGVGVDPTNKLHVSNSTNGISGLTVQNSNVGTSAAAQMIATSDGCSLELLALSAANNTSILGAAGGDRTVIRQSGGAANMYIGTDNNTGITIALNNAMVAQFNSSTGNFGIHNTSNPANRLSVAGAASIGTSYYATTAPTNGLIVEGNTGVGYSSVTEKLEVNGAIRVGGTAAGTADGTIRWTGSDLEGRKSGAWVSLTAGGAAAAGANMQVQFNDNGSLGADADFRFDKVNNYLFLTSGVADGSLWISDTNFGLDFVSSTFQRLKFQPDSYLQYDRGGDELSCTIASALSFTVGNTGNVSFSQAVNVAGLATLNGYLRLQEESTPGAPGAGYAYLWPDTNGGLWFKNDGSVETQVTTSGLLAVKTAGILTPAGTSQTIDLLNGDVHTLDLESATGNVTLTLNNPIIGKTYIIKIIQDSTTPRNIVWPGTVKWQGGSTPTISTGADAIDIVTLLWDGTNYYANIGQNYL